MPQISKDIVSNEAAHGNVYMMLGMGVKKDGRSPQETAIHTLTSSLLLHLDLLDRGPGGIDIHRKAGILVGAYPDIVNLL